MTSVVGILNKQGVAIAADSAVTRGRLKDGRRQQKITKNGNKMIRLCEAVPIAVMVTGSADFLRNPWEVIIRRYRQQRGGIAHSTVEDASYDFFTFIQSDPVFWDNNHERGFVRWLGKMIHDRIVEDLGEIAERKIDGSFCRPATFVKSFLRSAASLRKEWLRGGVCPHFKDYSLEEFRSALERHFCSLIPGYYPEDVLEKIEQSIEETVWTALRSKCENIPGATLIFTGYGKDQDYPSLVSAEVREGFDRRVNYHIRPEDIVRISEAKPVAICPFAQDDIIRSVLRGVHIDWSGEAGGVFRSMVSPFFSIIFHPSEDEDDPGFEFRGMLSEVKTADLDRQFFKNGMRLLDKNQREWEKALKDKDLESLASLADCLIDLTGIQRVLTFSQEGVGGPVDVAVISKNAGFTWLRRKNWYHKDGPMGV